MDRTPEGTYLRVPTRESTPESLERIRDWQRLTEQLIPMHRYPTCPQKMDVRALVMTEAYREGVVGQQIWCHQNNEVVGDIVHPDTGKHM